MNHAQRPNVLSTIIVLVTCALVGHLLAHAATDLIAASFFGRSVAKGVAPSRATAALPGAIAPDVCAILARNVFDVATGPLCPVRSLAPAPTAATNSAAAAW